MPVPVAINTEDLQQHLLSLRDLYEAADATAITRKVVGAAIRPLRDEYRRQLPIGPRRTLRKSNVRDGVNRGPDGQPRGVVRTTGTAFVANFLSGTAPRFTGGRTGRRGIFRPRAGATSAFRGSIPRVVPNLEERAVINAGSRPIDAAFGVYNELVRTFPLRGQR